MITSLDQLTPDTRAAARAWLDASVAVVGHDLRDDVRNELTTALCEGLDAGSTPEDLAHLVTRLGPVTAAESRPRPVFGSRLKPAPPAM